MNCTDIEDLILNESEPGLVESHVRQCEDCQAFLEGAHELESSLMRTRKAPERMAGAVLAAIAPRPSYLPELLDFVGWAAMIAVMIEVARELLAT